MRDDDIKDIVEQPQRLQLWQDVLIARLGELSGNSIPATAQSTRIPPDTDTVTARTFAIGDRVRIRNPGRFQENSGVVITITANRITVQARNGIKIVRAPHNIIFDNE
jgi:hypothetical protein